MRRCALVNDVYDALIECTVACNCLIVNHSGIQVYGHCGGVYLV